ncbi:MAG TPA: sodium ion-translocating decarboxylase subunit beta [Longimicrobiales bacterium]|nr:sodium ion-translocating decarboxylase subunit beta [Longimicrobiales bacterium]
MDTIAQLWHFTAFSQPGAWKNLIMIVVGLVFITLAIRKEYEPLLLVPIGFGILVGNIPFPLDARLQIGIYESGSVLNYLYFGVLKGIYPPLIFLGIGAMTDFSALLSNPKLVLLGAAAQVGIFATLFGALHLGFSPQQAAAIGIIGGADGPTAIFISSKLAPDMIGAIAIAAYSYMALVPVIQPPIMRLLTSDAERRIRMKPTRQVTRRERILFPVLALLVTTTISPGALPLLGMMFFGNLLKESGVTDRLARTASTALIDIVTILIGFTVGASTQAGYFLRPQSIYIFALGAASFAVATAGGILFAKLMNVFLTGDNRINPLIGAAGVSAVPDSARVVQVVGRESDPDNYLLMHAMGPNVAGVIGSAAAAGVLLAYFTSMAP